MINLFFGEMLPPSREPSEGEGESVLVGTASPVRLRVEPIEHHLTPNDTVCIGTFLNGKMISRCAVPAETAEDFLSMELFGEPVALALNVRVAGPGLEANLLALVPLADAEPEEDESEPWKRSVPGAGYEHATERTDGVNEGHLVGIFLGQVVRFRADRKHPDSLLREAANMLAGVVRGRIGNVVDRLIQSLEQTEL